MKSKFWWHFKLSLDNLIMIKWIYNDTKYSMLYISGISLQYMCRGYLHILILYLLYATNWNSVYSCKAYIHHFNDMDPASIKSHYDIYHIHIIHIPGTLAACKNPENLYPTDIG